MLAQGFFAGQVQKKGGNNSKINVAKNRLVPEPQTDHNQNLWMDGEGTAELEKGWWGVGAAFGHSDGEFIGTKTNEVKKRKQAT